MLLVAPDPETRVLVAFMLRRLGYRVAEARSGPDAVAMHNREGSHFDLLLADAVMPRMNGHDVAERMRERLPNLRVVLLAEASHARQARRAATKKGLNFLCRPFTIQSLAAAVREALDAGRTMIASGRG